MNTSQHTKTEFDAVPLNNRNAQTAESISAVASKREKYISGLPAMVQGAFAKAYTGKSPTKAIKAKCIDCMGCEEYRTRIRDCATVTCTLHPYRPYQTEEGDE